jgi:Holliday junction DNA helicase RuvB
MLMSLRPRYLSDINGQEDIKEALKISIDSANIRNDALGHVMLSAQGGLGKTTLAYAIANELDVNVKTILGGNIKSLKDILPTIVNIGRRDVLFIDEIHRVTKKIAESLYTILEDFRIDVTSEDEEGDSIISSINLPRFTMIGATTELGMLRSLLLTDLSIATLFQSILRKNCLRSLRLMLANFKWM